MIDGWTDDHLAAFDRDGFLIVEEGFIDDAAVELMRERFDRLFAGDYATGIRPDEVNWVAGRDPEDRTFQMQLSCRIRTPSQRMSSAASRPVRSAST